MSLDHIDEKWTCWPRSKPPYGVTRPQPVSSLTHPCVSDPWWWWFMLRHYDDVIMGAMASQITSLTIVYSTVIPTQMKRKHQSSASLAFVWGIHRGPVNPPHKWPVTRKMSPFDDVIMDSWQSQCHVSRASFVNVDSLVQVMVCPIQGSRPLPKPVLTYCWLDLSVKF